MIIKIGGLPEDDYDEDELDINEHVLKKIDDKELNDLLVSEKKYDHDDDKIITKFVSKSSMNDLKYYKTLSKNEKLKYAELQARIESINNESIPLKFQLLDKNFDDITKSIIFKKLAMMSAMSPVNGEYHKLKNWINAVCNIPFGKIKELPVKLEDGQDKIVHFMKKTKEDFDNKIYGHVEAKDQINRIIAQWISNPTSKGNVIGIHGKPGVGKTTLIKDGLAKALNLPFAFVPLGGAHDSSFLDGHGFTYEGSTWGKIAELLMQSKYMNPIIYFDELDKISDTTKGQEIINVLIHLTDPSQNDNFNDKYFSGIPLDLSKALIIFTYNDDAIISPILKDRIIRIETKDYTTSDKVNISKHHMIPEIKKQFGIKEEDIEFNDDMLIKLINNTTPEAGVRNLKRNIESIVSNINLNVLLGKVQYPVCIDSEIIDTYKQKMKDVNPSIPHMYL
jgi:ATP-dependent Lon protease